tara:strand:+ start:518 stop:739 length:222 start_codon:yes stop_codon:yes gene_type:complete
MPDPEVFAEIAIDLLDPAPDELRTLIAELAQRGGVARNDVARVVHPEHRVSEPLECQSNEFVVPLRGVANSAD